MLGHDTQVVECAEWLTERGHDVLLVSGAPVQIWEDAEADLANDKNGFTGRYTLMNFVRPKVKFLPFHMVKEILPGEVILSKTGEQHPCTTHVRMGDMEDERIPVDTVVIHLRQRPVNRWMEGLEADVPQIYKIGDCLEPRQAIDAMADGGRIGREI
jgi:2,4-dienoyl-CoA reductase (NADPH2)